MCFGMSGNLGIVVRTGLTQENIQTAPMLAIRNFRFHSR